MPPKPIRELRELTRYRKALIHERTRQAQRLHKLLEDTGIKLANAAGDPAGRLWPGDARGRWSLAPPTPRSSPSWPGAGCGPSSPRCARRWQAGWRVRIGCWSLSCSPHLDDLDEATGRPSGEVARVVAPFSPLLALLCTIPGVDRRTAEVVLAEIGTDMARFPSAGHLASRAGLCPGTGEPAGKHHSGKARKGSKWLRTALVQAANAAARTKGTYLAAHYARIKGRRGHTKAIVAVAHSILVIAYHLLERGEPYADLGAGYFPERHHSQAYANRLVRQLERLGHRVTLEQADDAA